MSQVDAEDGPVRVQLRRTKGWRMPPNTVKVTRPSVYGNPYIVGADGQQDVCVEKFRALVTGENPLGLRLTPIRERFASRRCGFAHRDLNWNERAIAALRGKNLACWCRVGDPCHADVLLELANATAAERTGKTPSPRNNLEQTNPETPQASSGKEGG